MRLTFVLFCFVYLISGVKWDMSDQSPWCLRTGGFFVSGCVALCSLTGTTPVPVCTLFGAALVLGYVLNRTIVTKGHSTYMRDPGAT